MTNFPPTASPSRLPPRTHCDITALADQTTTTALAAFRRSSMTSAEAPCRRGRAQPAARRVPDSGLSELPLWVESGHWLRAGKRTSGA